MVKAAVGYFRKVIQNRTSKIPVSVTLTIDLATHYLQTAQIPKDKELEVVEELEEEEEC